ncbi:hypothetical protein [Pedobacter aquatilis]|uniref:hypothetical protein n=1 Tax=Pedobacter aquatilis TaxID=351343 RepID=UPI00292D106D|nr:hypothetical protein [Pedobacter aquatilis]
MISASKLLPQIVSNETGIPIYFLTGKKYLYQTLFCLKSIVKYHPDTFKFFLVDDGTFDTELKDFTKAKIKNAEIIDAGQVEDNLRRILPKDKFPNLHHKRKVYPHIKKLTDIHSIEENEWKLVLDSDMLFWSYANEIVNWLNKPEKPIYMQDCEQSYGYSIELMETLSSAKIPSKVNVGVIGLKSSAINWECLENWVAQLEKQEKTSYYLEQALTAMIIGNSTTTVLDKNRYIVNPTSNIIETKYGVLHHYVDLSKNEYFNKAWKKI